MNTSRIVVLFLLITTIGGCVFHRENILEDAEYRLMGRSRDELLSCAGKPSATRKSDGTELLIYTNGRPSSQTDYCKVTFTLKDGRLTKFDFVGDLTGMKDSAEGCYQVVRRCW